MLDALIGDEDRQRVGIPKKSLVAVAISRLGECKFLPQFNVRYLSSTSL